MEYETLITRPRNKIANFLHFVNDVGETDVPLLIEKIKQNAHFSTAYILLLSSATVICTLGLLLSSAPVVIGGMIMSPLMWPLMKIAAGFSFERRDFVKQALFLLLFSVFISLGLSYLITLVSPVKLLNQEIIARTSPTLLDPFVAIIAGSVAALGIANKKISDTLAGVAIATSLLPPLCVGGIGLALGNQTVASGGLLLFFSRG